MPLLSLLVFFLLGLTIVAIVLAVMHSHHWYWVAALASWNFSFLTGFSIGLYAFSVTVVVMLLALGHLLGVIHQAWHSVLAVASGLALWAVLIATVDDYWLFFPIYHLFDALVS